MIVPDHAQSGAEGVKDLTIQKPGITEAETATCIGSAHDGGPVPED